MSLGLLGYKVGMTQVFVGDGTAEPVTVLQLGPCPVLQIKYPSANGDKGQTRKDGYAAVQLGFKDKPRKSATRPEQVQRAVIVDVTPGSPEAAAALSAAQRGAVQLTRGPRTFPDQDQMIEAAIQASPRRAPAGGRRP